MALLTNALRLRALERQCTGLHGHAKLECEACVAGRWPCRTALATAHPARLAHAWARPARTPAPARPPARLRLAAGDTPDPPIAASRRS